MNLTRKQFFRFSGFSGLLLAGKRLFSALTGAEQSFEAPKRQKRWAMVIDMQKCIQEKGCDKCITACNKTHNVPVMQDRAHEVKWIWKEPFEDVFIAQANEYTETALRHKPVLVMCNHCDNPPCVRVCPTQATWKREDGIVMMDWHRCIGCRYCVAACPYGSRSFNWMDPRTHLTVLNPDFPTRSKGVVEKCTFCEERLAKGQIPACVESCPEKAMVFGNLDDPNSEVRQLLRNRYTIRRKPELGTGPEIYYIV